MQMRILPDNWNAKEAGDRVLAGLRNICLPRVKGAHDSDFLVIGGKAYIVYMANDERAGENAEWPFVYNALSVVDAASGRVEKTETFAASEMMYENGRLPVGACFVPRIIQADERTLRVFFSSEQPGLRESQTWFLDYDLASGMFSRVIRKAVLETADGPMPMEPQVLYREAKALGFRHPQKTFGLYPVDGFKRFDGRIYAVLNNYPIGQNAWAVMNEEKTGFRVLGHLIRPFEEKLTEAAVNRLPDGTWLAICRQEGGDRNYHFSRSPDGIAWSPGEAWPMVPNGTFSKPTFECFGGVYHLGWQEATKVNGAFRSVFNIEVSRDGLNWERKYRFESERSFQYPTFRESGGSIYVTVTQGDSAPDRKERIMFGRLEP